MWFIAGHNFKFTPKLSSSYYVMDINRVWPEKSAHEDHPPSPSDLAWGLGRQKTAHVAV